MRSGELKPEDIATEVFLMPAAAHGEMDGHLHEHPAPDPVARPGARPARRRPVRPLVHRPARPAPASAPTPTASATATGRSTLTWDYIAENGPQARALGRGRPQEINGYDVATGEPVPGLRRPQGRRLDGLRGLDLQRRLRRTASTRPGGATPATATRRRLGGARVGLRLAGQPPDHVQPRVRRPGGPAVVRAQGLRLLGRGGGRAGRARRPRLPGRQAPDAAPQDDATGWTRFPRRRRS